MRGHVESVVHNEGLAAIVKPTYLLPWLQQAWIWAHTIAFRGQYHQNCVRVGPTDYCNISRKLVLSNSFNSLFFLRWNTAN